MSPPRWVRRGITAELAHEQMYAVSGIGPVHLIPLCSTRETELIGRELTSEGNGFSAKPFVPSGNFTILIWNFILQIVHQSVHLGAEPSANSSEVRTQTL